MKTLLVICIALCLALSQLACGAKNPAATSTPSPDVATIAASPTAAADIEAGTVGDGAAPSSDAFALYEKGWEAYKKNHDEDAVEAFKQALAIDPDYADARYKLGLAYDALQKKEEADREYEKAVEAYKKFIDRHADDAVAHYHLGLVYGKLHKYDDAVKVLKQAAKLSPEDSDLFYELGFAHGKLAQYPEAVAALNKSLELDPDNFRAQEELERARDGKERREAFLKQQEKLQKQQLQKVQKANANTNTQTNSDASPPPTPATAVHNQ